MVKETLCYNVFVLLGYLYYRKARVGFIAMAFLVALLVLGGLVALGLHFVPMQANKFPPNLVFLFYGLCALCLLSLLSGKMRLPQSGLVQLWNCRGYTIYLYQNLVIAAVAVVRDHCFPPALPHGLCFALCVLLALVLSTLLSFLTSPFERKVMAWLDYVAKRCGRRLYM